MSHYSTGQLMDFNSDDVPSKETEEVRFIIERVIQKNRYGQFIESTYRGQRAIINMLSNINYRKVAAELAILKELEPVKRVIRLLDVIEGTSEVALVFENFSCIDENKFYNDLSKEKLRIFLKTVFQGICDVHSHSVVHRDIKLSNILVSPTFNEIKFIVWSNGSFIFDDMSPMAGSRTVRSPDMLLGHRGYLYSCDSWSIGVMILTILSEGVFPFRGSSQEMLEQMSQYLGKKALTDLIEKYELSPKEIDASKFSVEKTKSFKDLVTKRMGDFSNENLLDLTEKLLTADPEERMTPNEALRHKYFKKKRESE